MTSIRPRGLLPVALAVVAALMAPDVLAQVSGEAKVTAFFTWFARLVQVAGYFIFLIALMGVGYKSAFQEGYRIADSKGVVIGGLVFGLAATIASFFTTP